MLHFQQIQACITILLSTVAALSFLILRMLVVFQQAYPMRGLFRLLDQVMLPSLALFLVQDR